MGSYFLLIFLASRLSLVDVGQVDDCEIRGETVRKRQETRSTRETTELQRRVSPLPEWVAILHQLIDEAKTESSAARRLSLATKTR